MRLLINTSLTALFSLGLLIFLTGLYRRTGDQRRSFAREFLFGILAALIVVLARALLPAAGPLAPAATFPLIGFAALSEETGKLAALGISRIDRPPIEAFEGVFAGAALGLGFALVENSWYIADATIVLLLRGVTAVPLHAVAAGYIGWSMESPARLGRIGAGWIAAVLLHGAYNAMIAIGGLAAAATIVLVGVSIALLIALTPAGD